MPALVAGIHVLLLLAAASKDVDGRDKPANPGHDGAVSQHPAMQSDERVVEVIPIGIHCMDEPHLPGARPMFDCLLALDGITDVVEVLIIDETFQPVAFCESLDDSFAVLERAVRQIAGDASVEKPSRWLVMKYSQPPMMPTTSSCDVATSPWPGHKRVHARLQRAMTGHDVERASFYREDRSLLQRALPLAPSCPRLSRASTSYFSCCGKQVVDGRDKPGHDGW